MPDRYNVIVVGSGAAGACAVRELTKNGLQVLLLEAGRTPKDSERIERYWQLKPDEPAEYFAPRLAQRQPIQRQHGSYSTRSHHFFVDDGDNPYSSPLGKPFTWIRGRQLGGRTLVWGGQTWRLSDFELNPCRPSGIKVEAWPLRYHDLSTIYDEVESMLGVVGGDEAYPQLPHGQLREPNVLTNAERFLLERSSLPIVRTRSISATLGSGGWPSFTSQSIALDAAIASGLCEVRADAAVKYVTLDDQGQASGVVYIDALTNQDVTVHASAVVLAASTVETVRILLNSSRSGVFDRSGTLGAFFADHCGSGTIFELPEALAEPDPPLFWNGDGLYVARSRNITTQTTGYFGGFGIMTSLGRSGLDHFLRGADNDGVVGRIPPGRVGSCVVIGEVLPRAESTIELDDTEKDSLGIPIARISLSYSENEELLLEDAQTVVSEIVKTLDARECLKLTIPPGALVHEVGGARMGTNSSNSVVDKNCCCWAVPNLLVVDGACWPTAAYQNPTLTIMTIATRATRLLANSMKNKM